MRVTMKTLRMAAAIAGIAAAGIVSGCSPIMQWQRQYLGDPIMQLTPDEKEKSLDIHIYPRREGSSGGDGGAGGGCGC
jgi:hypothetical protein